MKMITELGHGFDIQLFAGSDSEAEGITGEKKAPDAGERDTGGKKASDAGEQMQAQRAGEFEALIRGEYKDLYDAHVQHIVKQRLRGSEETVKKYKALSPGLQLLEKKYGVAAGDAEALSRALLQEDSSRTRKQEALARRQYEKWLDEAEKARESYPGLDMGAELADGRFRSLIRSGVPVGDAYELVHRRELMEQASRDIEEKLSRRILSGAARPREGGMSSRGSAVVKNDVSRMSKKARQDIIRRVQQGERISF